MASYLLRFCSDLLYLCYFNPLYLLYFYLFYFCFVVAHAQVKDLFAGGRGVCEVWGFALDKKGKCIAPLE